MANNEMEFVSFVESVVKKNGAKIRKIPSKSTDYNVVFADRVACIFSIRSTAMRSVWQINETIAEMAGLDKHHYEYRKINLPFNIRVTFYFSELSETTKKVIDSIVASSIKALWQKL